MTATIRILPVPLIVLGMLVPPGAPTAHITAESAGNADWQALAGSIHGPDRLDGALLPVKPEPVSRNDRVGGSAPAGMASVAPLPPSHASDGTAACAPSRCVRQPECARLCRFLV